MYLLSAVPNLIGGWAALFVMLFFGWIISTFTLFPRFLRRSISEGKGGASIRMHHSAMLFPTLTLYFAGLFLLFKWISMSSAFVHMSSKLSMFEPSGLLTSHSWNSWGALHQLWLGELFWANKSDPSSFGDEVGGAFLSLWPDEIRHSNPPLTVHYFMNSCYILCKWGIEFLCKMAYQVKAAPSSDCMKVHPWWQVCLHRKCGKNKFVIK